MKKRPFLALLIVLFTVSGASCAQSRKAKDLFEVDNFSTIEASMVGNIEIIQSDRTRVTAEGDEALLDILEVSMEEDKLILTMQQRYLKKIRKNANKLVVSITTPTLTRIDFDGVGNILVDDRFTTPRLTINSRGVGNFTALGIHSDMVKVDSEGVGSTLLGGKAARVEITSEGVGNVDAEKLIAREALISSDGVGNVSCYATEYLKIHAQGIGKVTYYGNPKESDLTKDGIGKITAGK